MSSPSGWLTGRRVLVTGAAGGIGAAVCAGFVTAGAQVFATDAAEVTRSSAHHVDVTDLRRPQVCVDLVAAATQALGGLDVVAHMAGVLRRRDDLADVLESDWDLQHDVNLKSAFFLFRAAGDVMREQGSGGRLIGAASQSWSTGGYGGSAVYAASKGGLVSLCRGLARTYGPAGITVNTVAPGAIHTPMLTTDLADGGVDDIVAATPLGRLGTPQEVADVVVFLASPAASFVTAATINVSGGWLAY